MKWIWYLLLLYTYVCVGGDFLVPCIVCGLECQEYLCLDHNNNVRPIKLYYLYLKKLYEMKYTVAVLPDRPVWPGVVRWHTPQAATSVESFRRPCAEKNYLCRQKTYSRLGRVGARSGERSAEREKKKEGYYGSTVFRVF